MDLFASQAAWRKRGAARANRRALTLIELTAAMLVLLSIIGVTLFTAIALDRSCALFDAQSALNDELSRQSEIVRTLPIATLTALTPIGTPNGIGTSAAYTSTNVVPLNGYVINRVNDKAVVPTVTWVRTRALAAPNIAAFNYYDRVNITARTTRSGINLTNSTVVFRLFEAGQ